MQFMEITFTLQDINATAATFLKAIPTPIVIALHGDMGAGKTTFVHAMCMQLGCTNVVSSPTFSIINQYETSNNTSIFHIDMYRLKSEQEAIDAGVEDCLYSNQYCFVEWPEKAPNLFASNTLHLYIKTIDANTRKLVFNL
jgi:tRNA threonylcarbamoyladenosine biosynthesis protein TsaE